MTLPTPGTPSNPPQSTLFVPNESTNGASNELLRNLGKCVAGLSDSVLITEAEPFDYPGPRILFVNEAFERQTGYSRAEVVGKSPRILQGPRTDQAELRRMSKALRNWEVVRVELINYTKDGREFCVEMDIVPIADEHGWFTHWVSVQRDVTARKLVEAEAATREAQRIESLGTLTSGIAHDFNNIVASILGNVALGRLDAAKGQSTLSSLDHIDSAAARARSLIQQILAYSRRQPQAFVRQALGPIVEEAVQLMQSTLPAGVSVNVDLPDRPVHVSADATQLVQVLLNLGTNAWHALPNRRGVIDVSLRVETSVGDSGSGGASKNVGLSPRAVLRVRDAGSGMDSTTRARMFDPYFTTKAVGEGTGLGLSVVWGIVEAHGGTVAVDTVLGSGTTLTVSLPLLPIAVARTASDILAKGVPHRPDQRVVCVDDNGEVLSVMARLLTHFGYEVTSFTDPVSAVAAVRATPDAFDIVVTDYNMPVLSGLDVALATRQIRADLPVVLASGYLSDELLADASAAGVVRVFGKEFVAEQLGEILRTALLAASKAAVTGRPAHIE